MKKITLFTLVSLANSNMFAVVNDLFDLTKEVYQLVVSNPLKVKDGKHFALCWKAIISENPSELKESNTECAHYTAQDEFEPYVNHVSNLAKENACHILYEKFRLLDDRRDLEKKRITLEEFRMRANPVLASIPASTKKEIEEQSLKEVDTLIINMHTVYHPVATSLSVFDLETAKMLGERFHADFCRVFMQQQRENSNAMASHHK